MKTMIDRSQTEELRIFDRCPTDSTKVMRKKSVSRKEKKTGPTDNQYPTNWQLYMYRLRVVFDFSTTKNRWHLEAGSKKVGGKAEVGYKENSRRSLVLEEEYCYFKKQRPSKKRDEARK